MDIGEEIRAITALPYTPVPATGVKEILEKMGF
jgi:hypothetical protein